MNLDELKENLAFLYQMLTIISYKDLKTLLDLYKGEKYFLIFYTPHEYILETYAYGDSDKVKKIISDQINGQGFVNVSVYRISDKQQMKWQYKVKDFMGIFDDIDIEKAKEDSWAAMGGDREKYRKGLEFLNRPI